MDLGNGKNATRELPLYLMIKELTNQAAPN